MASLVQELESGVLAAIITASNENQAAITTYIGSGETAIQAGFTNLIKNIPTIKGMAGMIAGPIEAAVEAGIESYVASLFAKYTPAQLYTYYIALLEHFQTIV